jgi:hypothetical protein
MKKAVIAVLVTGVISLLPHTPLVYAQATGQGATDQTFNLGDDLNVSIGFRTWFNNWKSPGKVFRQPGNIPLKLDTDGEGWIPTLGIRYKDFFISASGLFGSNYDHSDIPTFPDLEMRMQRKEVDVNLGYYILPWLAVSAGYKGVFLDYTCLPLARCFKDDYDFNGPTAGLSVNIPIPEWKKFSGFSVYGNAGGGYMWAHESATAGGGVTNHAYYSNFEAGIAYKPPVPFALTFGYRYQRIETQFKSSFTRPNPAGRLPSSEIDETKGPVLGISFVF